MKLNKNFISLGDQKKEINSIIVVSLWVNMIMIAIAAIGLIGQIIAGVTTSIILLISVIVLMISLVLMIQVKKSGLYMFFIVIFLQITYSLLSEIRDIELIVTSVTTLVVWSCLLFLKKNGRSAWSTYLSLPLNEKSTIENDVEKSPKWLEFTVFALAGAVVLFILYSTFIYLI